MCAKKKILDSTSKTSQKAKVSKTVKVRTAKKRSEKADTSRSAKTQTNAAPEDMASDIISQYMEYVLEHEKFPKSVYKFCKHIGISEAEFYRYFGSFDSLQNDIWNRFFEVTINLSNKNADYASFSNREKLLTFFYTFFELLTVNRSYVLFSLEKNQHHGKDMMRNMGQLKGLKKRIKGFAATLIQNENMDAQSILGRNPISIFSEGAWVQFLFLLRFWVKDNSPGFEKTDVAIEKSVNTVFDVFNTKPLETVLDFGKFLWKEATHPQ